MGKSILFHSFTNAYFLKTLIKKLIKSKEKFINELMIKNG